MTRHGVQSGVQIERNRAELRATQTAVDGRIAPDTPGLLRLGAGRSQVQILSPRSVRKACECGPFLRSVPARIATDGDNPGTISCAGRGRDSDGSSLDAA